MPLSILPTNNLKLGPGWSAVKKNVCRTVSCGTIRLDSVLKEKLCIPRLVTCIGSFPLTTGVILRPVVILKPLNPLSASKVRNF